MKELLRVKLFLLRKNKTIITFSIIFLIGFLITLGVLTGISTDEISIAELFLVNCLFLIVSIGIHFFYIEKNRIIPMELINDHSLKEIIISDYFVCLSFLLLYEIIIHIILSCCFPTIFQFSIINYIIIILIYLKVITILYLLAFFSKQAILIAVVEWFIFAMIHVFLIIISEFGELNFNWLMSYLLLSELNRGAVDFIDIIKWIVSSVMELIVIYIILRIINKNSEWK